MAFSDDGVLTLTRFNELSHDDARNLLLGCCSSPRWADEVAGGRPYAGLDALLHAADEASLALTPADVDDALAGHPRIGERPSGAGRDAQFSRAEQAGLAGSGDDIQARLRAGNAAYEQRFDRVFLIRAAGRSPEEILGHLTRRLEHDDATEAAEVAEQLRQITHRRLQELIHR